MRTVSRDLAELRLSAERLVRDDDWSGFLSLIDQLRGQDEAYWPYLWAPCAAIALEKSGAGGVAALEQAIAGGFRQPELLPLAETFGHHREWPRLVTSMAAAPPAPQITLTRWPTISYGPHLVLEQIDEVLVGELRRRMPSPQPSAWATAQEVLRWATTSWEHANDHVEQPNALEILDRVAAGERFACVEYSIVLSQALNAVGIPSRRLDLLMPGAHVGLGRGHVVSEAWIDDLDRWVVLDGQNGAWWGTPDEPLGWEELSRLFHASQARPEMVTTARVIDEPDVWWQYFDTANACGLVWGESVVPIFQGEPMNARLLVGAAAVHHPDLSELSTGLADSGAGPALTFHPVHPNATAVAVGEQTVAVGAPVEIARLGRGGQQIPVATITPYGRLRAHTLSFVTPGAAGA